jgi:hypothetical protein
MDGEGHCGEHPRVFCLRCSDRVEEWSVSCGV